MDKIPPPPIVFNIPKEETPFKGIIIFSIVSLLSIIVLSKIYTFININSPFFRLNVILPFGYALLLGYFMSWGIFLGKIKGMKNVIILSVIGSFISVYLLWTIWTAGKLDTSITSIIGNLFQSISEIQGQEISIRGRSLSKETSSSIQPILWILETLLVFLVPIFVIDDKPPKFSSLIQDS